MLKKWKSKALVGVTFQAQHAPVTKAEGNNSLTTPGDYPPPPKKKKTSREIFTVRLSLTHD